MCGLLSAAASARADLSEWAGINDAGTGDSRITHDGSTAQVTGVYGGIDGDAWSDASYGVLHAYSHGMANDTLGYAWVTADAKFEDQITITGGSGTGYFTCDFSVDGSKLNGGGFPAANIYWSNQPSGVSGGLVSGTQTAVGTQAIAFTYGQAFDFYAELDTLVSWGAAGSWGEGLADFGNTAKMTDLAVLDSNYNPVAQFGITGASGTDYSKVGAVPEPSDAALLLAALPLLMLKRRG